jgi:hypothetical protein
VKHVLPRQHRPAERRLPQRVPGALAVRHVQKRRTLSRLPTPPGEVAGAARAMVERLARTADDARQLLSHPPQTGDARIDLVDLRRHPHPQRLRRGSRPPRRTQVLGDLRQREADRLRLLDRPQEPHRLLVVRALSARLAIRLRQQASTLVIPERLDVHSSAHGNLADSHGADYRPVPWYGNQVAEPSALQVVADAATTRARRFCRQSTSRTCSVPAIGIAASAPSTPAIWAPIRTETSTASGESCTVRP